MKSCHIVQPERRNWLVTDETASPSRSSSVCSVPPAASDTSLSSRRHHEDELSASADGSAV